MPITCIEYYSNNNINKPIEEIYADIDLDTNERSSKDTKDVLLNMCGVNVMLPPFKVGQKQIKGLLAGNCIDYLYEMFPHVGEYFVTIGNSMWGSIPHSKLADYYYTCYENPHREKWFKKTNPDRAHIPFIPYQDADISNEHFLMPVEVERDIDILMISRFAECKNIDIFLKALMYIHKKHRKRLNAVIIVGRKIDTSCDIYKNLVSIAGSEKKLRSYINFVEHVDFQSIFMWYSRAKFTGLTSIFEGKNRSIQESLLCNTPVICFESFNQYIRGESPIMPENCGYLVPEFSPEAFGEELYRLLKTKNINYNTRETALTQIGRKFVVEKLLKTIPYFGENIPELFGVDIFDNEFLNRNIFSKYGSTYYDFLYIDNPACTTRVCEYNNLMFLKYLI